MTELLHVAQKNLFFIGFCLLILVCLFLIALLCERLLMKQKRKLSATRTVAFVAVFSALSAILMFLEIPVFFVPSFYKLDLSELPVLICAFYLGPVAGIVCEFIKVLLFTLLHGTTSAFVGEFANFSVGCALVLPAAVLYGINKTKKGAMIALAAGTGVMTVFGSLFNAWYLLPKFSELYGIPLDAIIEMGKQINPAIQNVYTFVAFGVAPFNLLKGVVVSVLTFLLYKRIERLFFGR